MKVFFLLMFATVVLAGCASAPTAEQLQNANYGNYPDNYEQIVKEYANSGLKDPYSAQWSHIKGPWQSWSSYFGQTVFGYSVCFAINAKNSYGGYTGAKLHYFMINSGRVVQHIYPNGGEFDLGRIAAEQRC